MLIVFLFLYFSLIIPNFFPVCNDKALDLKPAPSSKLRLSNTEWREIPDEKSQARENRAHGHQNLFRCAARTEEWDMQTAKSILRNAYDAASIILILPAPIRIARKNWERHLAAGSGRISSSLPKPCLPTGAGAERDIETTLRNLKTDYVDLLPDAQSAGNPGSR